jgi:hypothetical protein
MHKQQGAEFPLLKLLSYLIYRDKHNKDDFSISNIVSLFLMNQQFFKIA